MKHAATATLLVLSLLGGCVEAEPDCFESDPECTGVQRDPEATILGNFVYAGSRPECARDEGGALLSPIRALGTAEFNMWVYDNPPPPQGEATFPLDVLSIPGTVIFRNMSPDDCLPASPTAADLDVQIEVTVPYEWPSVRPAIDADTDIRITGLYDRDHDYIPLFFVRNSATEGDLIGGALDESGAFRRITLGAGRANPLGQRFENVDLTVALPVRTEPPLFRFGDRTKPLSTEETVTTERDVIMAEEMLYNLMTLDIELITDGSRGYAEALGAAGLGGWDFDPRHHSWFILPADADENPMTSDLHPILAANGVPWLHPVVIIQRARTPEELALGVPAVSTIATLRPTDGLIKRAVRPAARIVVVPGVALDLIAGDLECRVTYLPPGNLIELFADPNPDDGLPAPTVCQELPSGRYDTFVVSGVAGGTLSEIAVGSSDACVDGICYIWRDAISSNQVWTIPNEMGDPAQIGPAALPAEQGIEARLTLYDPNPDSVATCTEAPDRTGAMVAIDSVADPVPARCCDAVRHLCDLPLCGARPLLAETDAVSFFESPREADHPASGAPISIRVHDGTEDEPCIPFPMPAACCP